MDFGIGTDRVQHERINARCEVDRATGYQVPVIEDHGLEHVASNAAQAVLGVGVDQMAVEDAHQRRAPVASVDVANDLRERIGVRVLDVKAHPINVRSNEVTLSLDDDEGRPARWCLVGELTVFVR